MLNALFGQDSQVNGKLHFEGAVQIDGTFTGSITTNDLLIIGEHAKITADINCGSAVVSGEVTGNLTAAGSVELQRGAHVKGDISTPTLAIDKGAVFDGVSKMMGAPATFGSLERRGRPRNK
jgi:cytoskeletal protein CcmA (bactofilin family)